MAESEEKNLELETVCPDCHGKGGWTEMGEFFPCSECHGSGYVPTDQGKAIIALMDHQFTWMLKQRKLSVS